MYQLRTSKDIVISLQDKGSRLVILDQTDYNDKVESNLNDDSFDLFIDLLIEELNGWIKVKSHNPC